MAENEFGKGLLYEVPEELKHEERVLWIFSFRQALLFLAFLVPAFVSFQLLGGLDYRLRLAAPAFFIFTGFVAATVKQIPESIGRFAQFALAPKKSSWLDDETVSRYVGVNSISGGVVGCRDGRLLSVLLVTPVDYSVLGEEQKLALVYGYRSFLNSLNFPVQIVMRTTKVNLREYFAKAKARAAQKGDVAALEELDKFEAFVEEFVASKGVNDRLFYLVVPQEPKPDRKDALRELEQKVAVCLEKLSSIGLVGRRLSDGSLVGLYASFFGEHVEAEEDYLSLLTMLDFAAGEYERLAKQGERIEARKVFLQLEDEKNEVAGQDLEKAREEEFQAKRVALLARAFKRGKQR